MQLFEHQSHLLLLFINAMFMEEVCADIHLQAGALYEQYQKKHCGFEHHG
jgi:cytochrome c oxidase assembly factor CtaG